MNATLSFTTDGNEASFYAMQRLIEQILKMMPVWFGIGFLGPVLAELYLRTPLGQAAYDNFGLVANNSQIYMVCMAFGGLYGVFAWRVGRWV